MSEFHRMVVLSAKIKPVSDAGAILLQQKAMDSKILKRSDAQL